MGGDCRQRVQQNKPLMRRERIHRMLTVLSPLFGRVITLGKQMGCVSDIIRAPDVNAKYGYC